MQQDVSPANDSGYVWELSKHINQFKLHIQATTAEWGHIKSPNVEGCVEVSRSLDVFGHALEMKLATN